jgi:CRP-like cAMP-binding protein
MSAVAGEGSSVTTKSGAPEIKASDLELMIKVSMRGGARFDHALKAKKKRAIEKWVEFVTESREKDKLRAGEAAAEKAFHVLRSSTRKNRTLQEIEYLRHFFIKTMGQEFKNPWGGVSPPTIPYKQMSAADMDQLCNEVDYIEYTGRSIIFLQGDFGNCYYMIARGEVGLYMEPSKDKEMSLGRDYARYRAKPFPPTLTDLSVFGKYLVSLPAGRGFGEAAILKATNKFRNSTCVTDTDNAILMILHLDTYNDVLRRHHFRHLKTKFTVDLLTQLPILGGFAQSVIASIAYTMKSQLYSLRANIVKAGQPIKNVLLIASGEIKVFPGEESSSRKTASEAIAEVVKKGSVDWQLAQLAKRLPQLAIAYLGHGQIIGENELHRGMKTFENTYIVSSAECEILEIPIDVYKKHVISADRVKSTEYQKAKTACFLRKQNNTDRRERAHDAIEDMMNSRLKTNIKKEQLDKVLPLCSNAGAPVHPPGGRAGLGGTTVSFDKTMEFIDPEDGEMVELDNAMLEYVYLELQKYFPNGFVPNEIPKKMFFDALQKRLGSPSTTRQTLMEHTNPLPQSHRVDTSFSADAFQSTSGTGTASLRVVTPGKENRMLTPSKAPSSAGGITYNTMSPRLSNPRAMFASPVGDKCDDFRVVEAVPPTQLAPSRPKGSKRSVM